MNRDDVIMVMRAHRGELEAMGVAKLAVFGSLARNEFTDKSDIDLLVEFDGRVGLFQFARVQRYLETILGTSVDLVTPDALHPALRSRILAEAINAA
jgi:predicted nucleotidyltransferase